MIPKKTFGRTNHKSSRIIFGGYALSMASKTEADHVLSLLQEYGINHIDTAPMYGKSEERIGSWMKEYRSDFFLATKTRSRSYEGAIKNLHNSLARLKVDYIDLWQMHGLNNPQGWIKAMGDEGTLKAFIEAKEEGLVNYLGITGHGNKVTRMHLQSLEYFDFDTVMLPYNYLQMQNKKYAETFDQLLKVCKERNVAVQTIKSVARKPWDSDPKTHNTFFYQPIESQNDIDKAVHWSLGLEDSFMITAGDIEILSKILIASKSYKNRPKDSEMKLLADSLNMKQIFSY